MNKQEKQALRINNVDFIHDVDVQHIAPILYQNGAISFELYEEIHKSKLTPLKLSESFLISINNPASNCSFKDLIYALRHDNVYEFLADKLESSLADTESNTISLCDATENDTKTVEKEPIYDTVQKIDIFTTRRKKIVRLAHNLKTLTHEGKVDQFRQIIKLIHDKYETKRFDLTQSIDVKFELADMKFTALDAEIEAKRVLYDTRLCGCDVFKEMAELIPYTSNPGVASMTYLARHGSSIGMSDGIDSGLAYLQYAKEHAEHVVPCKDTGMVYYIEVNLLAQKYEATQNDDLKTKVLKTAQHAMSQFENENETIRIDYQIMLLLKIVFCYLGIGLFGNKIKNVKITENDRTSAKDCIDFIEKPKVWNGMAKRRKMLFLIAKTEFYRQTGSHDLAEMHAKESRKLAKQNGWKAELPNIELFLKEIEKRKHEHAPHTDNTSFFKRFNR